MCRSGEEARKRGWEGHSKEANMVDGQLAQMRLSLEVDRPQPETQSGVDGGSQECAVHRLEDCRLDCKTTNRLLDE